MSEKRGGRERRRREALGHPISPIKGGGNVGEFQSAVASLLAQVVGAHVEVLGRELVCGVGGDRNRRLVVDVEDRAVAAASD